MSKIKVSQIDTKERQRIVGELLDVISSIRKREEMFEFLFRLMTPSEVIMLARRLQIAKLLLADKTYDEIRKQMKVSHRTIADIEGWLDENSGRKDLVFKKLKLLEKNSHGARYSGSMLDKYAHHRFLKNLFS